MESVVNKEWEEVLKTVPYSKLGKLNFQDGVGIGIGTIDLIDDSGILWKTFSVKIEIPENYPAVAPKVFEVGGDLPQEPDWHVNYDGSCCVGTSTKVFRKLKNNITIKRWLDIVVMPYFFDQVYKIENGVYKGKEYNHGSLGLLEDYKEWWSLSTNEEVIDKLKLIIGKTKYGRNEKCFCGSSLKFKKCHLQSKKFEGIHISVYAEDLRMIEREMNELLK